MGESRALPNGFRVIRPKVMHVTTTDISLALLLGPQLVAFQNAGYDVVGVSAPGRYVDTLEQLGIRHVALQHATRAMNPWRDIRALFELIALFRSERPMIVHTHNPKPGLYGRLAARIARVPIVVNTVHGLYALPEDPLVKRWVVYGLERIAAAFSDAELLQNIEDESTLKALRIPPQRIQVMGNGIDLARFSHDAIASDSVAALRESFGASGDDVVVGCVGRLVWEKGYREIFDVARTFAARQMNVHFVIVGPLDEDKADAITEADIAELEKLGNITFLGSRDDVERIYPAFDVYVLGSYREGFPRSAMEAAAMGVPIIATNIRGCRQVVDDGSTGLLVEAHDALALERAITTLVESPELRRAFGDAGRRKAALEFDQETSIDITLTTYGRLRTQCGL